MNRRTALLMAGMGTVAAATPALGSAIARATRAAPVASAFDMPATPAPSIEPARLPAHLAAIPGLGVGEVGGIPIWTVQTPDASAVISVFGGQVLSFIPAGGHDVFWMSPTLQPLPAPIRGGVPVCWPYFARQGQTTALPAHGFVRTLAWELRDALPEDDGSIALTLAPPVLEALPLRLMMQLRIGRSLTQALLTENISQQTVIFTQALHSYFRVSDAMQVEVGGLDGCPYLDKLDQGRKHRQSGDWNLRDPRDPGRSDRIYTGTQGRYVVRDGGFSRKIHITSEGSQSAVLWNPGHAAAQNIPDIGSGWRDYIALETANAGPDMVELPAGGQHRLQQRIDIITIATPARCSGGCGG